MTRKAAYSEGDAWRDVRATALAIRDAAQRVGGSSPGVVTFLRGEAAHLTLLADAMLAQLADGLHANPAMVIYGLNPPEVMSRRVYAIEYRHTKDGKDYRHDFDRGVSMSRVDGARGIMLRRPDGKPLAKEF